MYLCDVYQNNRVYRIPPSPSDKAHRSSWIVFFHCNYMPLKKMNTSTRNGNLSLCGTVALLSITVMLVLISYVGIWLVIYVGTA